MAQDKSGMIIKRDILGSMFLDYGARHLVTATLDSGQIGGGIFFFCNTPVGRRRQIFLT